MRCRCLAELHRPGDVPLTRPDTGERLKRGSHRATGRCLEDWPVPGSGRRPPGVSTTAVLNATPLAELTPGAGRRAEFAGLAGLARKLDLTSAWRHRRGLALRWHRPGDHGQLPQRRQQHGDAVAARPGDPDRHQLADAGGKPAHDPASTCCPADRQAATVLPSADPVASASRLRPGCRPAKTMPWKSS